MVVLGGGAISHERGTPVQSYISTRHPGIPLQSPSEYTPRFQIRCTHSHLTTIPSKVHTQAQSPLTLSGELEENFVDVSQGKPRLQEPVIPPAHCAPTAQSSLCSLPAAPRRRWLP